MRFSHGGFELYYSKVGHGPHLSFLHGFCERSSVWQELIRELSSTYTCLSIDLPGFGQSAVSEAYGLDALAATVHALFEQEGMDRPIVFGHSMGGYLALELLAHYPQHLGAIGLIHSTATADSDEKRQSRLKVIDFVRTYGAGAFLEQFYPNLVAPAHRKALEPQLIELVSQSPPEAIIGATQAMMNRRDHMATIAQTDLPILFLTGDQDAYFAAEHIYEQASTCACAEVVLLPGSGHLSMLEDPEACSQAVADFIRFVHASDQAVNG